MAQFVSQQARMISALRGQIAGFINEKNWNWEHMKKHRELVKSYQMTWIKKQIERNPLPIVLNIIKEGEETLDVFNLNIARQNAELEINRRDLTRAEDQQMGWFEWGTSWIRGKFGQADRFGSPEEILNQFETKLTVEEKRQLYDAIDYQQNISPTDYPIHYVENQVELCLNSLSIAVEDALRFEILAFTTNLQHRPSAQAFHIKKLMKAMSMEGDGGQSIITILDDESDFLGLEYEANAPSILKAIDVFRLPKPIGRLNQLSTAANMHYENLKKQGLSSIQSTVDVRNRNKFLLEAKFNLITLLISADESNDRNKKPDLLLELKPFSFNGCIDNRTHGDRSTHFHIFISEVKFTITPTIAQLLQAINAWIAAYHNEEPLDKMIQEPMLVEYENYWAKRSIRKDDYWWFRNVADAPKEDFAIQLDILSKPDHEKKLFCQIKKFAVVIESTRDILPLIYMKSNFNAIIQDWTDALSADISLQLQVRVRDHARLGISALPNEPQVRKFMKRLENSVHVLCVLADAIAGGQGPAATQEELQAITNGERALDLLLNYLYATFSSPSSGAETE